MRRKLSQAVFFCVNMTGIPYVLACKAASWVILPLVERVSEDRFVRLLQWACGWQGHSKVVWYNPYQVRSHL